MPKIAVLDTGLFPDRETLAAALDALPADFERLHLDARRGPEDARHWDAVLDALLGCERVLSL